MKKIIGLALLASFASCGKDSKDFKSENKDSIQRAKNQVDTSINEPKKLSKEEILRNLNQDILNSLKTKNYDRFAGFIHPEKGVRFSMYTYVNPQKDKLFRQEDFIKYILQDTKFTWGERDGTGEPLVLSLKIYLETWVFKKDFKQSEYVLNEIKGHGNSLNNIKEMYPAADFTENYIAGSDKYSGMDWNSLRFVFEIFEGEYKLVGVVNDQWTI